MGDHIVIFITSGNSAEADKIAEGLVQEELVACVNIIPSIKSIYKWKGKICNDNEVLLIAKSHKSLVDEIISWVKKHHSYETPEIIAVPIVNGSEDYLNWINDCCLAKK